MPQGTVKFFNAAKGFGFITPDENGKEVFLPATSVSAAGIADLKAGQRISFEILPDTKGPKAIDLKTIADVRVAREAKKSPAPVPGIAQAKKFTVYLDPASDEADDVVAELRRAGHEPDVVDYIVAPPSKDELKRLSLLLRESNQSLVRKYEHLFLELRLDDRFISDGEFWGAIFEHPSLINGPVVATASKASICRSEGATKSFLENISSGDIQAPPKPKGLPERLLRMIAGEAVTPSVVEDKVVERPVVKAAEKAQGRDRNSLPKKPVGKAGMNAVAASKGRSKSTLKAAKAVKKAVPKAAKKAKRPRSK
jgi:cold shock CspA family protein/arsenate reductase-like glutaredoxin family protein